MTSGQSAARDPEYDPDRVVIRDKRKLRTDGAGSSEPAPGQPAADQPAPDITAGQPADSSQDARLLAERTADLQRLQAEFANYRRRAERERLAAGDLAVGGLMAGLLPVLDDIDRARAHGDLTGALKSVADGLETVLTKFGLERFGDVGDPFDPTVHEAVTHEISDDVAVATATMVMRPGYRAGERLLRPAMVGVTEPATPQPAAHQTAARDAAAQDAAAQQPDAAQPSIDETLAAGDEPHE